MGLNDINATNATGSTVFVSGMFLHSLPRTVFHAMRSSWHHSLRNIMREDVALVKSLWDHEVERIRLTESYLVRRFSVVDALQMEDLVQRFD